MVDDDRKKRDVLKFRGESLAIFTDNYFAQASATEWNTDLDTCVSSPWVMSAFFFFFLSNSLIQRTITIYTLRFLIERLLHRFELIYYLFFYFWKTFFFLMYICYLFFVAMLIKINDFFIKLKWLASQLKIDYVVMKHRSIKFQNEICVTTLNTLFFSALVKKFVK